MMMRATSLCLARLCRGGSSSSSLASYALFPHHFSSYSSSSLWVTSTSTLSPTLALCCPRALCSTTAAAASATAKRTAATAAATARSEKKQEEGTTISTRQQQEQSIHIDPKRLPSTIPGITQEELAAKLSAYHTAAVKHADQVSVKAVAAEVDAMRRSLTTEDFAEYMRKLEQSNLRSAKESAKLAAMSPTELHRYQMKERRKQVRYEWYKVFMLTVVFFGSIFFIFFFFIFFA